MVAQIWSLGSSLWNCTPIVHFVPQYRTSLRSCTPIVHFVFQIFIKFSSSSARRFRFCCGLGRSESACSDPAAVLEDFTLLSVLPFPMADCRANQVLSKNSAIVVGVDHSAASARRRREFLLRNGGPHIFQIFSGIFCFIIVRMLSSIYQQ